MNISKFDSVFEKLKTYFESKRSKLQYPLEYHVVSNREFKNLGIEHEGNLRPDTCGFQKTRDNVHFIYLRNTCFDYALIANAFHELVHAHNKEEIQSGEWENIDEVEVEDERRAHKIGDGLIMSYARITKDRLNLVNYITGILCPELDELKRDCMYILHIFNALLRRPILFLKYPIYFHKVQYYKTDFVNPPSREVVECAKSLAIEIDDILAREDADDSNDDHQMII